MAASYPSTVKTWTALVDSTDYPQAAHLNTGYDEVTAIEQGLLNGIAHLLKPDSTAGNRDLGTTGAKWRNIHLSGQVNLGANPTAALEAATKQYVDDYYVLLAGDTMTGALVLYGNPTAALQAAPKQYVDFLNVVTATTDVTNTVTETTAYTYTVPGGTLGTAGSLRLLIFGDVLENVAGGTNLTIRGKYGATTFFTAAPYIPSASATRRPLVLELVLHAKGATNSQVAVGTVTLGDAGVSGTAVAVVEESAGVINRVPMLGMHTTVAEDSTADKALVVTYQWITATTSRSARVLTARLERQN